MLGGHWQGRGKVGPLFDAGNIIYILVITTQVYTFVVIYQDVYWWLMHFNTCTLYSKKLFLIFFTDLAIPMS